MKNILMVCLGNICRSPMATGLLKHYSDQHQLGLTVSSAGIQAVVGAKADPLSIAIMKDHGIDISTHRAQQLTSVLLHQAELILVMESEQQHALSYISPSAYGKVHRLGKWQAFDIPDPYKKTQHDFEQAFSLIENGLQDWCERLWKDYV